MGLFEKKTIKELSSLRKVSIDIPKLRANTEILIVDDEGFNYLENLRNVGFTRMNDKIDLDRLLDAKNYDIVLLDIMGIGKKIHGDNILDGGKFLMKNIKETFPHIFLIGYSGSSNYDTSISDYLKFCDHRIDKDANVDEFTDIFDNAALKSIDPVFIWKNLIEPRLDVLTTKERIKFEDLYVKSIQHKKPLIDINKYSFSTEDAQFIGGLLLKGLSFATMMKDGL